MAFQLLQRSCAETTREYFGIPLPLLRKDQIGVNETNTFDKRNFEATGGMPTGFHESCSVAPNRASSRHVNRSRLLPGMSWQGALAAVHLSSVAITCDGKTLRQD